MFQAWDIWDGDRTMPLTCTAALLLAAAHFLHTLTPLASFLLLPCCFLYATTSPTPCLLLHTAYPTQVPQAVDHACYLCLCLVLASIYSFPSPSLRDMLYGGLVIVGSLETVGQWMIIDNGVGRWLGWYLR